MTRAYPTTTSRKPRSAPARSSPPRRSRTPTSSSSSRWTSASPPRGYRLRHRRYFPDPAALAGRTCMFVTNLEPRVIRGLESDGMLFAVSDGRGQLLALGAEPFHQAGHCREIAAHHPASHDPPPFLARPADDHIRVRHGGVIAAVFLETGCFFGFFLPGDSLLFTAGFFATQGYLSIGWLLAAASWRRSWATASAYAFGRRAGRRSSPARTRSSSTGSISPARSNFYERQGGRTIVLARFIRWCARSRPSWAGIGGMRYRSFLSWNVIGGFGWTWLLLLLGYGFAKVIPSSR